jgi:murein endopeptidase
MPLRALVARFFAATSVVFVMAVISPRAAATPAAARAEVGLVPVFALSPKPVAPKAQAAATEPEFPYLAGESRKGAISVGDTSYGRLVAAKRLEESKTLAILPLQRERDLRYGSEALVSAIEFAAKALHSATGSKLWVGNLSAKSGGDISYSVSHNSGRDADIAFCYKNARGKPVDPPDLVPLTAEGVGRSHGLLFDVERTWLVVKALLTAPGVKVQYLFVAQPLREMLIAQAQRLGESFALREHAALVMRQPRGSAAHNDHLHLRVYCSERDVRGGCVDTGAIHPGIDLHAAARSDQLSITVKHLDRPEPEERRRALDRMVLLAGSEHCAAARARLSDPAAVVRGAAARALAALGGSDEVDDLDARLGLEADHQVRLELIRAIGAVGGKDAGEVLARTLGVPRRDPGPVLDALGTASSLGGPAALGMLSQASAALSHELLATGAARDIAADRRLGSLALMFDNARRSADEERAAQLVAIEAVTRAERLEPVPALIALLDDAEPSFRARAARALRFITNRGDAVDWEKSPAPLLDYARLRWHQAWRTSHLVPRDMWLASGFLAAGYRVPQIAHRNSWELVRAVAGPEHLSFNAQRVLMRLADHRPPAQRMSAGDACRYWMRWVKGSRNSAGQPEKPPEAVVNACARAASTRGRDDDL